MAELADIRKKLKVWETTFVKDNGRKPGKGDIDVAPPEIQDTYRIYAKLKKEHNVTKSETPQKESNTSDTNIEHRRSDKTGNESIDDGNQRKMEKSPTSEPEQKVKAEVWGAQFDRNPQTCPIKKQIVERKEENSSYLKSLSDKMFKKSLLIKGPQPLDRSSSKWRKPDTPHPGKVVSRNPFGTALKNPFSSSSGLEEAEDSKGDVMDNFKDEGRSQDEVHEKLEDTCDSAMDNKLDVGLPSIGSATSHRTSSMFSKTLKITKKYIDSGKADTSDLYLGKYQGNKLRQSVLPKGLSALVTKHKELNENTKTWEPNYDEVDGEDRDEDQSVPNEDSETGSHSWDVPVKSLIIDDMRKSIIASKDRKQSAKSANKTHKHVKSHNFSESDGVISECKDRFDIAEEADVETPGNKTKITRTYRTRAPRRTKVEKVLEDEAKDSKIISQRGKTKVDSEIDDMEMDVSDPTVSRIRKKCPEVSEDNHEDSDYDQGEGDDSDEAVKGRKRKKGKSGAPAAKKRRTQATSGAVGDDDDEGGGVKKAPVKRAAPRAKPVSNDNFVRLNMKVKTYKRKGHHMTGQQYKRKMWKQKMAARSKSYGNSCFKCGKEGHWANKCPGIQSGSNYAKEPVLDEDFPDLQEAVTIARGGKADKPRETNPKSATQASSAHADKEDSTTDFTMDDMPPASADEDVDLDLQSSVVRTRREVSAAPSAMEPLIQCGEDETLPETPGFVRAGLRKFGYDTFRPGQEEAVMRILCGLSTLVVLSTGGGKSLCYQLPAYLYAKSVSCFTLVISPLVSLMEDQVTGLPNGVNGVCMHTNMTPTQREKVLTAVKDGKAQFLLVSPEAIAGGSMSLISAMSSLPPVAFVCIDESHCLSEWSHNFRPSYLRLCKVLQDKLGIKCFLGLTATATLSTATDVSRHLKITNFHKAMIRGSPVPKNLLLSVSRDEDREQALIGLLQGDRFCNLGSIIIYCTRREQTDKVATVIRTCMNKGPPLQAGKGRNKKGPKLEWDAESYHAGLSPAQRKRVQNAFMSGRLRVVAATVAFGMGLDKSDVRGVIHFNMPKSFESYVQEIGRAGRDGEPAQCHLFLNPEGKDLCELRRHTYANTVEYRTLKKLVQKVFPSCRCLDVHKRHAEALKETAGLFDDWDGTETTDTNEGAPASSNHGDPAEEPKPEGGERICPGHERSLPIEQTVIELDVKEEGISTLLCYLELHDSHWVENLPSVYHNCKIQCYEGPSQLQAVAKKCPPVAVAIAKARSQGRSFSNTNTIEFSVVEISDTMGWDSGPVKKELKLLQWNFNQAGLAPTRTGVMVELTDLAFHFRSPGDFTVEELDDILQFLHTRVQRQEKAELRSLSKLYHTLKSVSHKNHWMCADSIDMKKNDKLKAVLNEYFDSQTMESGDASPIAEEEPVSDSTLGQVISDIRQFHGIYGHEHSLTGRAIARIFHGIASPCFPATTWGRVRRFWRSHLNFDFNQLVKLATREMITMRQ